MGKRGKLGRNLPKGVSQQNAGSKLFYARIKLGGLVRMLPAFIPDLAALAAQKKGTANESFELKQALGS